MTRTRLTVQDPVSLLLTFISMNSHGRPSVTQNTLTLDFYLHEYANAKIITYLLVIMLSPALVIFSFPMAKHRLSIIF